MFKSFQNFLIPEIPKMCDPILVTVLKMQPHYSQSSRENATPSSGTSPVASYKEVPPPGLGVPLLGEYLFRSSVHKKAVSHRPLGGSDVSARLHKYLKAAAIDDGETPHSFRVGLSYTLKGLGCTPDQIAQYVGWRSTEMALLYTRRSGASLPLDLLERVTLGLAASVSSKAAPSLADQRNLQKVFLLSYTFSSLGRFCFVILVFFSSLGLISFVTY